MKIPLTVVVLTKNEEVAIRRCLESVSEIDQVIVIDSNSTDQTVRVAQEMGASVIDFKWNGKYPKKKQWALESLAIRNDWVLFLDADEALSTSLIAELRKLFDGSFLNDYGAFVITLDYFFMGKLLRFGHKVKKVALLNRSCCSFPLIDDLHVTNMWEVEGHYQPICKKQIGNLRGHITHLDPDTLFDYFARHNRYSDWEAELRMNPKMQWDVRNAKTSQGAIFDRIPGKPFFFFVYSFLFRFGWRDGRAGLNYALALSFYYWQISIKVQEKRIHAQT